MFNTVDPYAWHTHVITGEYVAVVVVSSPIQATFNQGAADFPWSPILLKSKDLISILDRDMRVLTGSPDRRGDIKSLGRYSKDDQLPFSSLLLSRCVISLKCGSWEFKQLLQDSLVHIFMIQFRSSRDVSEVIYTSFVLDDPRPGLAK